MTEREDSIAAQPTFSKDGLRTATAITTPPRTPTATTTSAHQLFSEIQHIHNTLINLPHLQPGDIINASLTRLVDLCITPHGSDFTAYFLSIPGVHDLCEALRPICASAEGELELYWANWLLREANECDSTTDLLHTFPYYQNYVDLTRLECSTLEAFLLSAPRRIAFIGSGPLPLTSMCMLDRYVDATVVNIDRDEAALMISSELCAILGYGARMSFACEDVSLPRKQGTDWEVFDVVFLAALVGISREDKVEILEGLVGRLKPGTLVVARSAQGLRSVLYPIFDIERDLEDIGLEILVQVHPWTKVVNSVVVMRVIAR